jgi:ABC-type Fe3+-hydroxamate transport system substrate-binding protein
MPAVRDMLGRMVDVPDRPMRIISLVPSQTELLADLGLENDVVGITKFCVHPERWFRSKTRIGGTKTVHIDKVAALKPDLIIANKEENVKEQIDALEAIAPVWVSDIKTLADALRMIREVSMLCRKEAEGAVSAERISISFAALAADGGNRTTAYCIWRNPWMWAGGDTFIHDVLDKCGLKNVLAEVPRYPEVSLTALAGYNPEVVLLSSEPYPFKDVHIAEVKALLPHAEVILVDGEMFSWYGSRLMQAPEYIAGLLRSL